MTSLPPKVLDAINLSTAKHDAEVYERGVKKSLEDGWIIWETGTPQKRLAGYIACTWPEDLPLVLTEDYIDLFHAGVMPALRAMSEWEAITQPQDDGKGGMVIPQPSDYRPFVWALWAICPAFVFRKFADDFRSLLRAQQAKA